MPAELKPRSLLLWALRDVRDRHLRFIAALNELRRTSEPGEAKFILVAKQRMTDQLATFQKQLNDILEAVEFEDDPAEPEGWAIVPQRLAPLARTTFRDFSDLQQELFPFLPTDRRPPADVSFFAARSFGLEPTRRQHRELFTLAYGKFTAWEGGEYQRPPTRIPTLPIPFTETLTPLRWPLLLHEIAHWYLPGGERIENRAFDLLLAKFGTTSLPSGTEAAFSEIFADLIAYKAFGVSYALALALEAQLSNPFERFSDRAIAPTPDARLRLVCSDDPYNVLSALPPEWAALRGGARVETSILENVYEVAQQLSADFTPPRSSPTTVNMARELLQEGGTASGVHRYPQFDLKDFTSVVGGDRQLQAKLFLSAVDCPCEDADILEAAWMLEVDRTPAAILAELRQRDFTAEDVERTVDRAVNVVARRDTAISRSLQAAAVHRWLMEWDEKISSNVQVANA